jgi:hypothetical protein
MTPLTFTGRYYNLADPQSKKVPYGSAGVEVWLSKGTAFATGPDQCSYVQRSSKAPFTVEFVDGDQGKKCSMFIRYVNKGGNQGVARVGPWSDRLDFIVT